MRFSPPKSLAHKRLHANNWPQLIPYTSGGQVNAHTKRCGEASPRLASTVRRVFTLFILERVDRGPKWRQSWAKPPTPFTNH
jgi:hypothetical protein